MSAKIEVEKQKQLKKEYKEGIERYFFLLDKMKDTKNIFSYRKYLVLELELTKNRNKQLDNLIK